ncbi:hypothetical protein ACFFMR_08940 [Micromonospora andamanensis]|uniref:Resolvase/invertase-type recombinase catalytic domain-containing protein n=1 Tax=Micromonospora andamanensis TaxID=1287068 RepID=A0ABQ4HXF2_9ACTN|nr:hypothetical protein [Micromonospora andamanensis]GIJ10295.1 hypothetical protein Van01_35090 [Micromonospora andamanensis]
MNIRRTTVLPRVAFYGRTADAGDLATATRVLGGQYQQCVSVLPDGAITAVFSDLGTRPDYRRAPASLFLSHEREISRDGGLDGLLTEANRPERRFDFVISTDVHRLSRDMATRTVLLRMLAVAGIEFLHAPEIRDGDRLPVMPWRLRSVSYINVLTQLVAEGGYL